MRGILTLVALLAVLASVGLLVKRQLATQVPAAMAPAVAPQGAPAAGRAALQELPQQVQTLLQQPRPMPDDESK